MINETLTPDDLQRWLDEYNVDARLIRDIGDTPTVPAAAQALGVETEQIIKTLLFLVRIPKSGEIKPVVVISNGEGRVDKRLLTSRFGVGKNQIKLAGADQVMALLGYPVGGVPPFGHRTRLPVVIDPPVLALGDRHDGLIFGGGGDDHTMIALRVETLVNVLGDRLVG